MGILSKNNCPDGEEKLGLSITCPPLLETEMALLNSLCPLK